LNTNLRKVFQAILEGSTGSFGNPGRDELPHNQRAGGGSAEF
jgi:hypothetical protein